MEILKKPFKQFTKLPEGYFRLFLVGWLILPLLVAGITAIVNKDAVTGVLIIGIPVYYVLARLAVWVADGFKQH